MKEIKDKLAEVQAMIEHENNSLYKASNIVYERLLYLFVDIMREEGGLPQDNPDAMEVLNTLKCLERYFPNCKRK